jgi:hypothetical protein
VYLCLGGICMLASIVFCFLIVPFKMAIDGTGLQPNWLLETCWRTISQPKELEGEGGAQSRFLIGTVLA